MEAQAQGSVSILDDIVEQGHMARTEEQKSYAQDLIGEFVRQVTGSEAMVGRDAVALINEKIAALDALISAQMNEVLHHQDFQKLESSWRGLAYFVNNTETSSRLKIRVLPSTRDELQKDLEKAVEFDQSSLFKKIYEAEYGTFGGTPFSLLVADLEFGRTPRDLSLLEKMAGVAATAHTPLITSASSNLFDLSSFTDLDAPRDLSKIFESSELARWRSFRESDDSRYVSLALPHILLRDPYGPDTKPVEGLNFVEDVDGKDHKKYLWGNAAYALGTRITSAFATYGWTAAIRGVEGGGLVENLPVHTFRTEDGDIAIKCPTEVAITDRREKELSDLGFISLVHQKGTDKAAFFGGQTVNKAKTYNTPAANANARISAMLPYVLAASRFAHYFKVMMRDKIGSFQTADQVRDYLQTWLSGYILLDDNASQQAKSSFPLREGRVDVYEVPGQPGVYRATAFLRPHFQLEELSASIRLVADLPAPAGG